LVGRRPHARLLRLGAPIHSPFDGEVVRAVFAGFAHLAPGSVNVTDGQAVRSGDIPCAFRSYDVLRDGAWTSVENGIPRKSERIRVTGDGQ
jgi:hypothetical protein